MTIEDKHSGWLTVRVFSETSMTPLTAQGLRFSPTEGLRTAPVGEDVVQLLVTQPVQQPLRHQTPPRRTHGQHLRRWQSLILAIETLRRGLPVFPMGQESRQDPPVPRLHLDRGVALPDLRTRVQDARQKSPPMIALVGSQVWAHKSALEEQSVAGGAPLLEEHLAGVRIARSLPQRLLDLTDPPGAVDTTGPSSDRSGSGSADRGRCSARRNRR